MNKDGMISRSESMDMAIDKVKNTANKDGIVNSKQAIQLLLDIQKGDFNAGDLVPNDAFMKNRHNVWQDGHQEDRYARQKIIRTIPAWVDEIIWLACIFHGSPQFLGSA